MSMNQRRPTGARTHTTVRFNKSDVVHALHVAGWELVERRTNGGEWNECRHWTVQRREKGVIVEVVDPKFAAMTGDRVDWNELYEILRTETGVKI